MARIEMKTENDPGLGTPFFSILKKERSVLFRSFLEFLATYETQKNVPFFFVLF